MKEISANILIPHETAFILVFLQKEYLVGDDPFYLKFWVTMNPLERNADFQSIFARPQP